MRFQPRNKFGLRSGILNTHSTDFHKICVNQFNMIRR